MAVAWNDNANNEQGYYVDRTTDNQSWSRVASLGADQSGYLDHGLTRLSQYGYRLTAWNSFGESHPVTITAQTGFSEGEPTSVQGGTITPNTEITGTTTLITYTYDSLSRLTAADYDSGIFYHYSYDSVGNRLSEEKVGVTTNSTFILPTALPRPGALLISGTITATCSRMVRIPTPMIMPTT